MSAASQQILERDRNIARHGARSFDVHTLAIVRSAGIRFTNVDATSCIFQFVSKVTVSGFMNGSLTVFKNEAMPICATPHGTVPYPTQSFLLGAGDY